MGKKTGQIDKKQNKQQKFQFFSFLKNKNGNSLFLDNKNSLFGKQFFLEFILFFFQHLTPIPS
jgi:hypothetical protein